MCSTICFITLAYPAPSGHTSYTHAVASGQWPAHIQLVLAVPPPSAARSSTHPERNNQLGKSLGLGKGKGEQHRKRVAVLDEYQRSFAALQRKQVASSRSKGCLIISCKRAAWCSQSTVGVLPAVWRTVSLVQAGGSSEVSTQPWSVVDIVMPSLFLRR